MKPWTSFLRQPEASILIYSSMVFVILYRGDVCKNVSKQMFVTHLSNVNLWAVLKACETKCFKKQTKSSFDVETFFEPAQMSKISTSRAMMNKGLNVQLYNWRFHLFNLVWSWILLAAMSSLFFCGSKKWIGSLFSIWWNKCDDP